MDSATSSIYPSSRISTSDVLRGLEDSRRSTPALPPGLPVPAGVVPDPLRSSSPSQRPVQTITPAVPILPYTGSRIPSASQVVRKASVDSQDYEPITKTTKDVSGPTKGESTMAQTHAHPIKDQTSKKGLKKQDMQIPVPDMPISSSNVATGSMPKKPIAKAVNPERASALGSESKHGTEEKKPSSPESVPGAKADAPENTLKESSSKRQPPGKLDIPPISQLYEAATPQSGPTKDGTPEKASHLASATSTSASRPGTPATTTESPFKKVTGPKTLRVVSTPKAETPSSGSATAHAFPTAKTPSRQPSIISMQRSDTPASEVISEPSNTSASLSRANSPPPATSKVGSAPVRSKTKSQLKKERQERAKLQEQEIKATEVAQAPATEEQAAAPLTGRKKKAKKDKQPKTPSGKTAPAFNENPLSSPQDNVTSEKTNEEQDTAATASKDDAITPGVADEQATAASQPSSATPNREISIASVFNDLQSSGLDVRNLLKHFKPITSNTKNDINATDIATRDRPISLTEKDHAALAAKEPLHLGGEDGRQWSRAFVTPSQNVLRALSQDDEARYIELEKSIRSDGKPTKFIPSRKGGTGVEAQLPLVTDFFVADNPDPPANPSVEGREGSATDDVMKYLNQMIPPTPSTTGSIGSDGGDYRTSYARTMGSSGGSLSRIDPASASNTQNTASANTSIGANANANAGRSAQLLSTANVKEAETAWLDSKKKTERLERELNALIKRNRKLLTGTTH